MADRLRAVLREPVTHFVLIGLALFAAHRVVSRDDSEALAGAPVAPREPIMVDASVRARLKAQWKTTHAAPPSEAELASLVGGWIDQEILYREGLRRGLDEGDLQIRDRVASQMAYVLDARVAIPEPSEEELRAWFEQNTARYAEPERVDFTHVFVDGQGAAAEARARELLVMLQGGADPDGLGDRFSGGRRFRGRKPTDLAIRFGDAFVDGIAAQRVGTWALRRSVEGVHLVRIDRWTVGTAPSFDELRDQVHHDWGRARRTEALNRAKDDLRAQWEVVESP